MSDANVSGHERAQVENEFAATLMQEVAQVQQVKQNKELCEANDDAKVFEHAARRKEAKQAAKSPMSLKVNVINSVTTRSSRLVDQISSLQASMSQLRASIETLKAAEDDVERIKVWIKNDLSLTSTMEEAEAEVKTARAQLTLEEVNRVKDEDLASFFAKLPRT